MVLKRPRKVRLISRRMPQDKFLCQRDKFLPMIVVQGKFFGDLINPGLFKEKSLTVHEEPRDLTPTIRVFDQNNPSPPLLIKIGL